MSYHTDKHFVLWGYFFIGVCHNIENKGIDDTISQK